MIFLKSFFSCHPVTRILLFVTMAVALQWMQWLPLISFCLILSLLLVASGNARSGLSALRRMRWLLITLLLIYAFATPGRVVFTEFWWSPTEEGFVLGALQVLRLAGIVGALTLLLHNTPPQSLLTGLYILAQPLRYLGADPERMAVRIWLTLKYAEEPRPAKSRDWLQHIQANAGPDNGAEKIAVIKLTFQRFNAADFVVPLFAILLLFVLLR